MKNHGLTLVELIAVVIILGILMAIGIPQYRRAMERARGATAYSVLANIQEAEKIHYVEFDNYSANTNRLGVVIPQSATGRWTFNISTTGTPPDTFLATATRASGPCSDANNNTLTVDHLGAIGRAWEICVDGMLTQ